MKKSVIRFGLIGGAISVVLMIVATIFFEKFGSEGSEAVGYTGIILSSLPIYFGIRHYKNNASDKPGFLKFLGVGVLIAVVIGVCYALVWDILYYTVFPDFIDKYIACMADKAQKAHKSAAEMKKLAEQAQMFKKIYSNPFSVFLFTFVTEPLPVGIVVSLISSAIVWLRSRNQ
jgi:hypothetical protein